MSDAIQTIPNPRDQLADEQPLPISPVAPPAGRAEDPRNVNSSENVPAIDVKALTDRALHFLATASNEALGACLVGLGAGTYLVLGRVGLVLIGVVGGVVLHATWEGYARGGDGPGGAKPHEKKGREHGVDVAHRILEWRNTAATDKTLDDESDLDVKLFSGKALDYSEFRPETAAALTELTDAVIRDYVKWWYSPILPTDELFPTTSRQTLTAFLLSISTHLSRKRPADNFVDFVTRSSSFMIIFFQQLSSALANSPSASISDAVDTYLMMEPDSTLANILDVNHQAKQFDNAADDILQNYLEAKTYNCKPAQTFLRQILSRVVLEMIVVSCSKPEWINGWIIYLLEDGEPELLNAIDAGVEGSAGQLNNMKKLAHKQDNAASAKPSTEETRHKRVVSKAQDAMDEAMHEAQRLSQLIAEEDAKRFREQEQHASSSSLADDQSESTTHGIMTPSSSQSDALGDHETIESSVLGSHGQLSPSKAVDEPPKEEPKPSFTSFDQLVLNQPPTALMSNPPPVEKPAPLTLHHANIAIFDDSMPGEKGTIKNKPNVEYLIQIEPASHHHSGWMTARKYSDLETLHEVLRRIAAITGTTGFTEAHASLPVWKGHTKASLRGELEKYLNDALVYKNLAESEGMKRFLEKESQMGKSPGSKGFGWPGQAFETMGKGMVDVLTKAPKEVAGGGKALFSGVTGVLGSVTTPLGGSKKNSGGHRDSVSSVNAPANLSRTSTAPTPTPTPVIQNRHGRAESTVSELPTHIRTESTVSSFTRRTSTDSLRSPNSPIIDQQPAREAPMERRPSYNPDGDGKRSGRSSVYGASRSNSRAPSLRESLDLSPAMGGDQILNLPPIPSEISDDYTVLPSVEPYHSQQQSRTSTTSQPLSKESAPPLPRRPSATSLAAGIQKAPSQPSKPSQPKSWTPISEPETTVIIELFFAVINELYTLSSAWQIRLTLLNAAKTFLLRPGNPQLSSIQTLIQSTVLDENTSDKGIAYHLRKMRENALPTEEELKQWPAEPSIEEKEKLRLKARKLLVERGMPQALTSVMGLAASGEALGKVFDALQEPRLARAVMFGLVIQGLRGITQ
ncbi:PXA domain-containing protein [Dendryphion nanum]|uniref:PXA domain-containing protein n=1 Tax=Dendryphion nanum TaxID=256645 RepID=A0A9P9DH32_9PLEO|nr:PXA domain-containing protein [Dendryphion nanum]